MRILFAGTPATAVPSLERLIDDGFEVAAVLTRAPAPVGRKRILTPSLVHQRAEELGIPVLTPRSLKDPEIGEAIAGLEPEAVAVVAYGLIIPKALLTVPRFGWINLHFSLLPKWRGAAPVNYALAAGDETTGISVFQIEEGLDTGPVLAREETPIGARETAGELLERLAADGAATLSATLRGLADGSAQAVAQQGEASYAPQFSSAWARVNWAEPATAIDAKIRAATPVPGAWTTLGGHRVKLAPVEIDASAQHDSLPEQDSELEQDLALKQHLAPGQNLAPGEISSEGWVGTGSTPVRLTRVAPAGKQHMDAGSWLRGARLEAGTTFDAIEEDEENR